jgi:ectoine hydroxylase-related dioxygenase (phytanoyl-CoA dioxygenase family)
VTRDSSLGARTHKALPVAAARPALDSIAARLGSFLTAALGEPNRSLPLLESGFMVTRPGARAQAFHRDVAPGVVSASSLSASVQVALVDTASDQGVLQVKPRSHRFDPPAPFVDGADAGSEPPVTLALPEGSVAVYALHLVHRGSANTAAADRPFYFFTLKGPGFAPPGLAYTIQPADIAQWRLAAHGVEHVAS